MVRPPEADRRWVLALALLILLAALVRVATIDRQGLWADEVFSLAMATGHSLEHPASVADAARGDFIQHRDPQPAAAYRSYLEHDEAAAGVARISRALLLSDQSPPLYYLLLSGWTRGAGTGDGALRFFSILLSLLAVPFLWSLGRELGGSRAAAITCILFALAPVAIRYSTEGRMYSMVWLLTLVSVWTALRLHRRGGELHLLGLLIVAITAGLLTHYFFLFVAAAVLLWLLWQPGRVHRWHVLSAGAMVGVIVAPWYAMMVANLDNWRVTQGWQANAPNHYRAWRAPFGFAWNFFSPEVWAGSEAVGLRRVVLVGLLSVIVLWRQAWARARPELLLVVLVIGAACIGPLFVDLVQRTYVSSVARYAIAALPLMFLLVAGALARSPWPLQLMVLVATLIVWVPGYAALWQDVARGRSPLREVAWEVNSSFAPGDLVVVHSIPSGVAGVARYLDGATPVAAWVGQLQERTIPDDLPALTEGYRRIFLVRTHSVGDPAAPEAYLREHAEVLDETAVLNASIVLFGPREGETFWERGGPPAIRERAASR